MVLRLDKGHLELGLSTSEVFGTGSASKATTHDYDPSQRLRPPLASGRSNKYQTTGQTKHLSTCECSHDCAPALMDYHHCLQSRSSRKVRGQFAVRST